MQCFFSQFVGRGMLWASLKRNPPQPGDALMKVMVFVKATKDSEAGVPPSPKEIEAMEKYGEALMAAGIVSADNMSGGLKPTRFAKRVHFSSKNRTVIDGPFAETKELVAGFALWEVKSIEEAVEWVKKSPMPPDSDVEIRPLFSMDDFAAWEAR
jgi:hypothetical protein